MTIRRALGTLFCLSPVLLLIVSGLFVDRVHSPGAFWLLIPAGLVALLNCYLSFARPMIFRWRHESMDDYRHVSGIPAVGSVLVLAGGIVGFGALSAVALGFAATLIDTGGFPWLLVATWRDQSLWDG